MLDILIESSKYRKLLPVEIDSPFVQQEGPPIKVNIPSVDDIFGDKLTAFAPNSIGVPYEKGGFSRNIEIIKQLYDLGNLFGELKDLSIISETFNNIARTEMKYRSISGNINIVLDDIFQTALCLSTRGKVLAGESYIFRPQ